MIQKLLYIFLLFFIYSVLGYIVEVIYVSIYDKKLTFTRGFFIGPYIPIYGTSIIAMTFLLERYRDDILVLFIMSTVLCTVVEYLTSLIMEKIFHLRWWDYSDRSFNINGRVCLTNSLLFGIGGIIITHFIHPTLKNLLSKLSPSLLTTISLICLIIFVTDFIITTIAMFNIKLEVSTLKKDSTRSIRKEITKFLKENKFQRFLTTRLLAAFPNIKSQLKLNRSIIDYKKILSKVKMNFKRKTRKKKKRRSKR